MSILPEEVRKHLLDVVRSRCDAVGFAELSPVDAATRYKTWTDDPEIGGELSRYIPREEVRVYIKDSLVKPYLVSHQEDPIPILRAAGRLVGLEVVARRKKPHGVMLSDGTFVVWSNARDWKTSLMALHEARWEHPGRGPLILVQTRASGQWGESSHRRVVEDAANKLGIDRVVWLV
jgi:hypothetical protein